MSTPQKDRSTVELLRHEVPYEYTNTVKVRRNKSGSFTLWIVASGGGESTKDCWQRNLKTPEDFARGFTDCVEFVDFNGMGLEWLVREKGAEIMKELDKDFAASLVHYLTTDPEHQIETAEQVAKMKRADEKRRNQNKGNKSTFRTLTMAEARREFPDTLYFTSDQIEEAKKRFQPKTKELPDPKQAIKDAMADAALSLSLIPEELIPKTSKRSK
jgi:hypothetical protein